MAMDWRPYWIRAKWAGKCKRCGQVIAKGARAYYHPDGKALYCDGDKCGQACQRDYESITGDETYLG